jgi:hypothetical protein
MLSGFRIDFDLLSLILGALLATIFWWLMQLVRPLLKQIRFNLRQNKSKVKEKSSAGIEDRYRKLVLRQVQGMHLAASLFSLDEIAVHPRLMAPPTRIEPGMAHIEEDVVSQTLPYMPAFPEIAAAFRAPFFSLAKALAGNVNIVLIGHPGTGKTVTLAHLATQIVNHADEVNHLKGFLPFFVHVGDLDISPKSNDLLNSIIDIISEQASVFDAGRFPKFIKGIFEDGRALLLIDGLDELAPDSLNQFTDYLKPLLKNYPKIKIVATCSPDYIDGLAGLGFSPLVVLPWGEEQQDEFLIRWADLWSKYVSNEAWAQSIITNIDSILLNRWLKCDIQNLTPLEFTLKTWGAYAGDIRGARPLDFIETHIRRMMPAGIPLEALGVLGYQVIANAAAIFENRWAKVWIRSFESTEEVIASPSELPEVGNSTGDLAVNPEAKPDIPETTNMNPQKRIKRRVGGKAVAPKASLLSKLVDSGLIQTHRNGKMRFVHVVFGGVLAGEVMNTVSAGVINNQERWSGRTLAMNSFASKGDATNLVDDLLATSDEMLERNILATGRLLRDAPRQASWRVKVMTALVQLIKSEKPLSLRMQAVAAIVLSEDPAGSLLFRQLMQLTDKDLRMMAILGSGALRDDKAVDQIITLIGDYNAPVRRAACLALVTIGTSQGLEAVAQALMRGDEDLRRSAAEALANNRIEGYATLQEGSTSKDILLRRAVVYGLARLDERWATEILERIQVEDEQWVVRNAAVEILDSRNRISPRIPKRLQPPHEAPWLIEFAGRYGVGIAPGAPTTDLLLRALKSEKEDERLAALNYLRYMPNESVMSGLFQTFFSTEDSTLKEGIFIVLWEFALGGQKIPSPMQYGLG